MLTPPASVKGGKKLSAWIERQSYDNDKWGPAYCVRLKANRFAFFGVASC